MPRERTCPEHVRCAGLDCDPWHRAGGGEPIDNDRGDMAINERGKRLPRRTAYPLGEDF